MRKGSGKESGFTLLELLIAITIFGLILVALTSGLHFAGRAWDQQQERNIREGDISAVQNVLRGMIASGRQFEGDATSLRFVGIMPAALERGGLFNITLSQSGDRLVLSWEPYFKSSHVPLPRNSTNLLAGVGGLELSYYVGAPQGWQQGVSAKGRPAQLIGIGLRFGDGRVWPPLVQAPMVKPDEAKN